MNLSLFIAKRYFFSSKKQNLINWISGISVFGVSIFTMSMIVILSVMNGLSSIVESLYSSFDPELKITPSSGKFFSEYELGNRLDSIKGIAYYTKVLEENVLLDFSDRQTIGKLKGVSDNFKYTSGIDSMIVSGEYKLKNKYTPFALLDWSLANTLTVNLNLVRPVKIWLPRRNAKPGIMMNKVFNIRSIFPIGIFSMMQDDNTTGLIIVPLEFAQELMENNDLLSAVEIKLDNKAQIEDIQKQIQKILGDKFIVKTRFQQHEFLYKVMKSEKWAIFLIFSFILIIASFNLTGSLTMLIIDKKKDIFTLQHLGAEKSLIRKIFLFEGWMIAFIGALIGLVLGFVICWLQDTVGLVELPQAFIVQYYPVEMKVSDFVSVFIVVLLIGLIASYFPVRFLTKKHFKI
ncbi:MAG: FtsX-like permease family protein [Bacteroidales bacterium]|nr:FtsX-like permease family protein [Bacteroidales bacterium]